MQNGDLLYKIAEKINAMSTSDVVDFLKAILTPAEIVDLKNRYLIIENLVAGKTQKAISQELSVSISQVTRGANELKYGNGAAIFNKVFAQK